jgi:hypothetical protein
VVVHREAACQLDQRTGRRAVAWLGIAVARATLGWPMALDASLLVTPLAIAIVLGVGWRGPALRAARADAVRR